MIKPHINILRNSFSALLLACVLASPSYAQFIDLNINIDAKLTAKTERPLDFGSLVTNSGRQSIDFGSLKMGIFSITALEKQVLLVKLNKPTELHHNDPAIKGTIPLQLYSRYGYSIQNYGDSVPLPEATNTINVKTNSEPNPWNTIYIFMYGSIDIGNIPDGEYSSTIVLNVEYI
ncbi:MAG: hypothetical protein PVI44_12920 [Balneolaceae bacterium]|jgi:hypothetical protein